VVGDKPVTITVRSTGHGPIISDTYGPIEDKNTDNTSDFTPFKEQSGISLPDHYAIALDWTALTPSSPFEAIWGFDKAQNWDDFRAAARNFHVPAQNLLYADTQGNIVTKCPVMCPSVRTAMAASPYQAGRANTIGRVHSFRPASVYL